MSRDSASTQALYCFQSSQTIRQNSKAGEFTWAMPSRRKATRISFQSLELPMTQCNVDERSNRLWFSEGLRVQVDQNECEFVFIARQLRQKVATGPCAPLPIPHADNESVCIRLQVAVPPTYAEVEITASGPGRVTVRSVCAHGLMGCPNSTNVLSDATIVCETSTHDHGSLHAGRIHLADRELEIVDTYAFSIRSHGMDVAIAGESRRGWLIHPAYSTPHALAAAVDHVVNAQLPLGLKFALEYIVSENRFVFGLATWPSDLVSIKIDAVGPLAEFMAIATPAFGNSTHTRPCGTLSCDPLVKPPSLTSNLYGGRELQAGWTSVALPTGWYTPCSRPMCHGQPYRLSQELTERLNVLMVHPTSDGPAVLNFRNPFGAFVSAPIPPGRYSPDLLAMIVAMSMRRADVDGQQRGPHVRTDYHVTMGDTARFEAFILRGESRSPSAFALDFSSPRSVSAALFGMQSVVYAGRELHEGGQLPHPTWVDVAGSRRAISNMYTIRDQTPTRKLEISVSAPPHVVGIRVASSDGRSDEHLVQTYLQVPNQPFASGFQAGDVVHLAHKAAADDNEAALIASFARDDAGDDPGVRSNMRDLEVAARSTPLVAVVLESTYAQGVPTLRLFCPQLRTLNIVRMWKSVEPHYFGFMPCLTSTLQSHRCGFSADTLVAGDTAGVITATGAFDFDHVPWVTMHINADRGRPNTQVQLVSRHGTRPIVSKIIFSPAFRDGGLPKDMMFSAGGEGFTEFTVSFKNPDGSVYDMQDAPWSFTLAAVFTP